MNRGLCLLNFTRLSLVIVSHLLWKATAERPLRVSRAREFTQADVAMTSESIFHCRVYGVGQGGGLSDAPFIHGQKRGAKQRLSGNCIQHFLIVYLRAQRLFTFLSMHLFTSLYSDCLPFCTDLPPCNFHAAIVYLFELRSFNSLNCNCLPRCNVRVYFSTL